MNTRARSPTCTRLSCAPKDRNAAPRIRRAPEKGGPQCRGSDACAACDSGSRIVSRTGRAARSAAVRWITEAQQPPGAGRPRWPPGRPQAQFNRQSASWAARKIPSGSTRSRIACSPPVGGGVVELTRVRRELGEVRVAACPLPTAPSRPRCAAPGRGCAARRRGRGPGPRRRAGLAVEVVERAAARSGPRKRAAELAQLGRQRASSRIGPATSHQRRDRRPVEPARASVVADHRTGASGSPCSRASAAAGSVANVSISGCSARSGPRIRWRRGVGRGPCRRSRRAAAAQRLGMSRERLEPQDPRGARDRLGRRPRPIRPTRRARARSRPSPTRASRRTRR